MESQHDDIDEVFENKNICSEDKSGNAEQQLKISSSQSVLECAIESPSIRQQPATDVKNDLEIMRITGSDSLVTDSRNVVWIEKDINILVKLKYLTKIDASTNNCLGKILTSVQCEPAMTDSESSFEKKSYSGSNEQAKDDQSLQGIHQPTKETIAKATKSDNEKELQNTHLLTTTIMKFANNELHNQKFPRELENSDRVHFFTPEVEKKWREIVQEEKRKRQKISHPKVPQDSQNLLANNRSKSMHTLNSSGNNEVSDPPSIITSASFPAEKKISDIERKKEASIIEMLGPIPPVSSKIFQGMSFILEYVSVDSISPHQLKTMESNSEAEYLKEWTRRPFVMNRLVAQITSGGGTLYKRSELVPSDKYANTKLIMNIPNSNAESLFCLSVGIESYSHQWIIRCCQENKIVNPAEELLPAGWSLTRQSYVEMYQRPSKKPFELDLPFIFVIPMHHPQSKFVLFWERIIQNAGGVVHLVESPEDEFMEGTVVLTYGCTPMWAIQKAKNYDIPLVTSQWAVECLIEGEICDYDAHPSFEYNKILS